MSQDLKLNSKLAASLILLAFSMSLLIVYVCIFSIQELDDYQTTIERPRTILKPATQRNSAPLNIGELAVGKTVSNDGRITKNETAFTNKDQRIFYSLELINPQKNQEIIVSIYHLGFSKTDQPTKVKTETFITKDNQQDTIYSYFDRPNNDWGKFGKYQLKVEIPKYNQSKYLKFNIYR